MYTQNTPVHVKLWHKEFWLMSVANMLMSASIYMLIPMLPKWLYSIHVQPMDVGVLMGIPGIGIFFMGCFIAYLVQRFRRNIVCIRAIAILIALILSMYYVYTHIEITASWIYALMFIRLLQGVAYGLANMVLCSTLIIDSSESFQRTEANHSAAWFSRLSLSLGPIICFIVERHQQPQWVLLVSAILCAFSAILILMVKFPFRAPEDMSCKMSLDRFFLPQGKWLFINYAMITTVLGITLSMTHSMEYYVVMAIGFLLSLLAQRFLFANAELKSEVITGLILIAISLLLRLSDRVEALLYISPILFGCGIGITSARFLLFFIKLSDHCQRGTSQSTYFLASEFGLGCGLFLGCGRFYNNPSLLSSIALIITAVALIMYIAFTHQWYIRHKNR